LETITNPGQTLVEKAFAIAATEGPMAEPIALRTELEAQPDPLAFLSGWDEHNAAWQKLADEFPSAWNIAQSNGEIDDQSVTRIASLIRWIMAVVRAWPAQELAPARLGTVLLAAKFCAPWGGLWQVVAEEVPCPGFVERLERVVGGIRTSFGPRFGREVPINEAETVEAFQVAERDRDWLAILNLGPRLLDASFGNPVLEQAVDAIAWIAPDTLLRSTSGIDQFTTAAAILKALPDPNLAAASENHFVQFALLHCNRPIATAPYAP
jgi:hypothetical protein